MAEGGPSVIVLSGIASGLSGTGRFISFLEQCSKMSLAGKLLVVGIWPDLIPLKSLVKRMRLIEFCRNSLIRLKVRLKLRLVLRQLNGKYRATPLVLIHPQTIGFLKCLNAIKRRSGPTFLYLTDSSFFCVKSYNHLPGETSACLECLGTDGAAAVRRSCKPFPVSDNSALSFVREARSLVREGSLRLLAQNETQANLAKRHFGPNANIKVVGLWTDDWETSKDSLTARHERASDIVFHGACVEAKGARWALNLAKNMDPSIRLLFPFSYESVPAVWGIPRLPNIDFRAMSWETGLLEAVVAARIVLVPSLWSAPIEGALIKSILLSKRVAVVDENTAFSQELSQELLLRLSADTTTAVRQLEEALKSARVTDQSDIESWKSRFISDNRRVAEQIVDYVLKGDQSVEAISA